MLEEVAGIGKDAAKEAMKIAAMEGHGQVAGDVQESSKRTESAPGGASGPDTVSEEKTPLQSMGPFTSSYPLASALQSPLSKLALVPAQLGPTTPGSSFSAGADFDEEIRRVLAPLS